MKLRRRLRYLAYKVLPLRTYLKACYWYMYKRKLNLENPQLLSEKLYYLKLYNEKYLSDILKLCYDKYTVKEYLRAKGCEKYMKEVYGVYDNADDIDFNALPEKFVLKITQSCGYNIICSDKSKLDIDKTKAKLNKWLRETNSPGRLNADEESYVFAGNAKIIAEKFMIDMHGHKPDEYNLFCFNGKVKVIADNCHVYEEEHGLTETPVNTYDIDWNPIKMAWGGGKFSEDAQHGKPDTYDEMIRLAEILSADFPFVRVDLFDLGDSVAFGELTWIPRGGNAFVNAHEEDIQFGKMLDLPLKKVL